MKYTNTNRDKKESEFLQTEPAIDGTTAVFGVTSVNPSVSGTIVPMVRGYVRLTRPEPVSSCNPTTCDGSVNTAVEIRFNTLKGQDMTALVSEVSRLLYDAVEKHSFDYGVVPPATATFSDA